MSLYFEDNNRHFVIVLSENGKNMLSAKVRWSDNSFLEDFV